VEEEGVEALEALEAHLLVMLSSWRKGKKKVRRGEEEGERGKGEETTLGFAREKRRGGNAILARCDKRRNDGAKEDGGRKREGKKEEGEETTKPEKENNDDPTPPSKP
jgi:hypothetical protein